MFKAVGSVVTAAGASTQAVQIRLELASFNLADKNPELAELDGRIQENNRRRWELLAVQMPRMQFSLGTDAVGCHKGME